tara:strand:- start:176 stop:715 length:540 start_codon:yes stop_codon:yes gene_type:complete
MKESIDKYFSEFGFEGISDYGSSCFNWSLSFKPMVVSISLGTFASVFEKFIGIEPMVYLAFLVLLCCEFITGIRASVREGNKIESKKFGRFILKILTYTLIIGIINVFRTRLEVPQVFGQSINIYAWIFYVSFNMIIIQLIISVFENLARLGYAESNKIFKALSLKADKWFDFNEKNKK